MISELTAQLTRDEGRERSVYLDHLGYATIGVGRLIDKRKGGGLRDDEIDYLLRNDINDRIDALARRIPWFLELDGARQGALLNMSFQLGVDGLLGFKNTLARVRAGNFAGAASGMRQSLWAKQTPERAERLAKQMETGLWQ